MSQNTTKVLQLNTSMHSGAAASSRLASELAAKLGRSGPVEVTVRDLGTHPVPHLDAETFAAFGTAPDARTDRQRELVAQSDALIAELRDADVLLLGLPMYNFGVPSPLKAWFDHVARARVTFKYTDKGPVGLLTGKKAYVIATRGGRYAGTSKDMQTGFVRNLLAFLGITDVEFVYAEGLAMGPESRDHALAHARAEVRALALPDRLAA